MKKKFTESVLTIKDFNDFKSTSRVPPRWAQVSYDADAF